MNWTGPLLAIPGRRLRLLPLLGAGLSLISACTFQTAGLAEKNACARDEDCLDGFVCSPAGRCQSRAAAADTGPAALDQGRADRDAGGDDHPLRPDRDTTTDRDSRPDADLAPGDGGGGSPDATDATPDDLGRDAAAPDLRWPDGEADQESPAEVGGCLDGPCPLGWSCNRFDRCAPPGLECLAEVGCPPGYTCSPDAVCLLPDQQCRDAAQCDAGQTCNPFGSCVAAEGEALSCTLCGEDRDCGGPQGVCFDASYRASPEGPSLGDGTCAVSCRRTEDCPQGHGCQTAYRLGQLTGSCRPRTTDCRAWAGFGSPCSTGCPGRDGFCEDLHSSVGLERGCSYPCGEDDDCPAGAICGWTWWHWNEFCRWP